MMSKHNSIMVKHYSKLYLDFNFKMPLCANWGLDWNDMLISRKGCLYIFGAY